MNKTKNKGNTVENENATKFGNLVVRKSNEFILGKYKSSLLEEKLVAIAITRIQVDKNSNITATIFPNELKEMLGREKDNGHIYRDLKKVSKEMTGHVIELKGKEGDFHILSLITNADYVNGHFTMTFNSKMSEHILDLKSHFTSYSLANTLSMKNQYSFRFYELIKMDAYKVTDSCPFVMHQYGVSELKFMVGVLDINDDKVRACQDAGGTWDEMADVCKEKRMQDWGSFKRRVLDKAKNELDEIADYTFDYNLMKSGRGGKVVAVELIIHRNDMRGQKALEDADKKESIVKNRNNAYQQMNLDDYTQPLPDAIMAYRGHNNLTEYNLKSIYDEADGDASLVIKAINAADKASETSVITNYVGWIINCVRNGGYDEPQMVSNGSSDRGDQIREAQTALDSMSPSEMDDLSAKYWKKAQDKNTAIYQKFVNYIESQGANVTMFEAVNTPGECGEKFMSWIKGEPIELI